jgi:hypothetical protein
VVDRPAEVSQILRALGRRRGGSTVGVTTAVHGAGGFGKSTIAGSSGRIAGRYVASTAACTG